MTGSDNAFRTAQQSHSQGRQRIDIIMLNSGRYKLVSTKMHPNKRTRFWWMNFPVVCMWRGAAPEDREDWFVVCWGGARVGRVDSVSQERQARPTQEHSDLIWVVFWLTDWLTEDRTDEGLDGGGWWSPRHFTFIIIFTHWHNAHWNAVFYLKHL